MLRKYVTSMTGEQFGQYGEKMLRTFCQYWPSGKIHVYSEDGDLPLKDERIEYHLLYEIPGLAYFLEGVQHFPIFRGDARGQYNYTYNVNAFARKAFAQMDAAQNWSSHLFWLDADTVTTKHIPGVFLERALEGHFMAIMKRKTWHACSSFVGWDCGHAFAKPWWDNYRFVYESGGLFTLPQWDDAYVLEKVCDGIPNIRDMGENISGEGPYNVFDYVFQGYAHHLKGVMKMGPQRYQQLTAMVGEIKPNRILEIGTWNGDRALEMNKVSPGSEYIGFDLFEEATPETDKEEKNVKRHFLMGEVMDKLSGMKRTLYKGNTRETFAQYLSDFGEHSADFIYIDGGHSVETIAADYANAKKAIAPGGFIVFDDYYSGMPDDEMRAYGAQEVLRGIEHVVFPIKDRVLGGGWCQMAMVRG